MPDTDSNSSSELGGMASQRQKHTYALRGGGNQPLLPDRSSIHWTNNTVLFDNVPSGTQPESYISIILLFLGVITARIGESVGMHVPGLSIDMSVGQKVHKHNMFFNARVKFRDSFIV